jgi:uncharacterized repeat protein (TIGR01451 family)
MFRKLVSNLPFHPAVLEQAGFYLNRLRQENSIRRLGLLLSVLVLLLQAITIIFPSKPSLATSANDLVYGAKSKDQILQAYNDNRDSLGRKDIRAIYDHYGIGSIQISSANSQKIGSRERDFISTGRGASPGIDTFVSIPGVSDGGIFQRPLRNWETAGHEKTFNTLTGMSSFGFRFWLITDGCGNIVFENNSLIPNLNIIKKVVTGSTAKIGSQISYQIQFQNSGLATAKGLKITDTLPKELSYVSYSSNVDLNFVQNGQILNWTIANPGQQLSPSQRWYTINLQLKVIKQASSKKVCNSASISANGLSSKVANSSTEERCITISVPTCPGTGLPIPNNGVESCKVTCPDGSTIPYNQVCSIPQLSCLDLQIVDTSTWDSRKFKTTTIYQKGASPKQIIYYVNNKKVAVLPIINGADSQLFSYKFDSEGIFTIKAELEANYGKVQPSDECQLTEIIKKPTSPAARVTTDKAVTNLTQGLADANNTTAQPGDSLKYTLYITNIGEIALKNFKLDGEYGESINDVLEYTDLIDKGDAFYNKSTNFLTWAAVDIAPGVTIQKTFTIKVKNPLPATPISASDPLSYDYNLQNRYGRQVIVHLNKPATKVIEQTANTLPNTGPGTGIIITFILVTVIAYFYFRSRLLAKELNIIYRAYSTGDSYV